MAKTVTVTAWIREDDMDEPGQSMADALRHIANLLDEGYTSGHYPTWEIKIDDDEDEKNETT